MEFLKNHYEKVVLGVVLLALAGVAIWLPVKIKTDNDEVTAVLEKAEQEPRVKALDPVDISKAEAIREQTANPPSADFSGQHNLFNSVLWIKTPDGILEKHTSDSGFGPRRVVVDAIRPLAFTIEFDRVFGSGYNFRVTKEAADSPRDRRPKTAYVSQQNLKSDDFTLLEARGPQDDPLAFELQINDTGEKIVVSRTKAYTATNGYAADLSYSLERKVWKDVRVKQPLVFANDTNIVIDINPSEVILRAVSNEKTTTIPFNAVP
jgi:hypothetical protein